VGGGVRQIVEGSDAPDAEERAITQRSAERPGAQYSAGRPDSGRIRKINARASLITGQASGADRP
jgi:hypothetical protein